ncbi:MAG: cation diffusion facilitator family transporter, partial [Oscillospiraceae bacterium]|nr:cation diffusion facilitator family transporter [Oscillospiraceae bacterium]
MTTLLINLFVKDKNELGNPAVRGKIGNIGAFVGIFCNIFLFVIKFIAGTLAGSVSLVVDAFNNLSDIGSSVVTLIGFKISNKPADSEHPFGHGRMEYMSATGVSLLIIMVGVELFKTSLDKVLHPEALTISLLTFIVLVISICIKLWMAFFNRNLGGIINSSALKATSLDSLSDCVATSAVLISMIIAKIFEVNIDPYVGIAVAVFIIYSGARNAKETLDPLLGMPTDDNIVKEIENYVLSYDDFVGVHDLIVHNYGPGRSFASLHVEVPMDIDIVRCHEQIDLCERYIL